MGLTSVYCILLLSSLVSLYHATMHICPAGSYCPAGVDCSSNSTFCEEGICPADGAALDSCDKGNGQGDIELEFTQSTFSVNEQNGPCEPVLKLSSMLECCTISVKVLIQNDTAKEYSDFEELGNEDIKDVIFPAGQMTATFSVNMINDEIFEDSETFRIMILEVSLPYGVILGRKRSAVVTILDDDAPFVSFESASITVDETDETVDIMLTLSKASSREHTIRINDESITATGCDYLSGPYSVIFPVNSKYATLQLPIIEDDVYELPEKFRLTIADPLPTEIRRGRHPTIEVTIRDNEELNTVGFEEDVYSIMEDHGTIAPRLELERPLNCCINIRAELLNMTENATEGDDYEIPHRIFNYTFLAGDTVASPDGNVSILDDFHSETDEVLYLQILQVSLPYGIVTKDEDPVQIIIVDDENAVRFAKLTDEVCENEGPITIKLRLDRPATEAITIPIAATGLTATGSGVDFDSGPFEIDFEIGQKEANFTISIVDDKLVENEDEVFRLTIMSSNFPPGFIRKNPYTSTITIYEDDVECSFDESSYEVIEGEDVLLHLSTSFGLFKDIKVQFLYDDDTATNGEDYVTHEKMSTIQHRTTADEILISTIVDNILEINEKLRVRAIIGEDKAVCSTTVTIVDNNKCEFEQTVYEIEEGGKDNIYLTFTKPLSEAVEIKLKYVNFETENADYSQQPSVVTLPAATTNVSITVSTKGDGVIEDHESFDVVAFPPSQNNLNCSTTVVILDDNHCSFAQSQYSVEEGASKRLTLTLDKPASASIEVALESDSSEIYFNNGGNKITFTAGKKEAQVTIYTKGDSILDRHDPHTITAKLPTASGSRTCNTKVTVIDNDFVQVGFLREDTYITDKNSIRGPQLMVYGTASFTFNVTVLETAGTATVGEDFEKQNYVIAIRPGTTRSDYLRIDVIDDDIVEEMYEYYYLNISENSLPEGVSATTFEYTRIHIRDDDYASIWLDGNVIKLNKAVYVDLPLHIMLRGDSYNDELKAGTTEKQISAPRSDIIRIQVDVPDTLRNRISGNGNFQIV